MRLTPSPSPIFTNASTRAELRTLIADVPPSWLYEPPFRPASATAETPAWRDVWHVSVGVRLRFNETLADRADGCRKANAHIQRFRDLVPESGSYFVSGGYLLVLVFTTAVPGRN